MLNKKITLTRMKSERSQPFLVRLFLAIIAFKRMIANRRKWQITKKNKQTEISSTLINEIRKSQKSVKYASFGRSVIDLNEKEIKQYRKDEAERKEIEKEKRIEIQLLRKKRRGGMRSYGDMKQLSESATTATLLADPYSLTVADRIRALKSKYSAADFYREDPTQKRIPGFRPPSIVKDSNNNNTNNNNNIATPATTTNKDLTNILQKNLHISRPQDQTANQSTSKIKSNLKNMKRLDLQEVLNYAPGTAVYFGATVAIQSRHGGFLSFNNASDIKASAHKILPSARFVIWNCDDLQDHGVVRYGDAVWLQAGVHEVLGAQYGGKSSNSDDGMRKIHPALINCRKENFFKAQQYGRWIVLNRADPTGMLGEQVLHQDQIMLEQEWCFLASQTPYDSFMETYNCLENDKNHKNSKKADFFHPPEECQWKLHLVTLPSDDNPDSRFRQYLLEQAKHQIKISTQERRKKETILCVSLARNLPPELQPDQVVARHMPHVLSPEATQYHLLSKFDKQMLRAFRSEGNDVKFLKHVYGPDSLVYKKAKENADAHAEEVKNSISKDLLYLSETITSSANDTAPKSTLVDAENAYWDVANMVLMNTKGWVNLPSAMNKFEDISNERKDIAARKIQKFLKEKMVNVFGWRRNFRKIDGENLRKLRHQVAINLPIPSNAVISKLKARTPLSLQNLSNNNNNNINNNINSPSKPLIRPESAPDLHKTNGGLGRKTSSLRNLQDAINLRPTTAPNAMTFLTEDPRDLYSNNTPSTSRKEIVALCRQRRSSSVSAMLTARKMLFSENSPNIPGSAVMEDIEDNEEIEPQTSNQHNNNSNNNNLNNDPNIPKQSKRRKKRFEQMIDVLGKTKERDYGLPKDVFQDSQKDISVYTTLHFLRASSSSPQIYGDISVKKKSTKSR